MYGKKSSGGGDMRLTGASMKGKSRAPGVVAQKRRVVISFPIGYSHSRTSVSLKK